MKIDSQFMIETFWIALSGVPVTLQLTFGSLMMAIPPAFFMGSLSIVGVKNPKN